MSLQIEEKKTQDALQRIAHALEAIARNLNTNFKTQAEKDAQRDTRSRT
jgi:hypothetical protein